MAKYEVMITVSDGADSDTLYITDNMYDAFETAYGYHTGKYYSVVSLDYEDYCEDMLRKHGESVNTEIYVTKYVNASETGYGIEIYEMPYITAFLNS